MKESASTWPQCKKEQSGFKKIEKGCYSGAPTKNVTEKDHLIIHDHAQWAKHSDSLVNFLQLTGSGFRMQDFVTLWYKV